MTRFTIASESKLECILYLVKQSECEDDSDVMRRLRKTGMSNAPFASTIGDRRIRLDRNPHDLGRCQNISKILPLFRNHFRKRPMEYNNGISSDETKRKELLKRQRVLRAHGVVLPILTSQNLTVQCHMFQSLAQKYLASEDLALEGFASEGLASTGLASEGLASGGHASEGHVSRSLASECHVARSLASEGHVSRSLASEGQVSRSLGSRSLASEGHVSRSLASRSLASEGHVSRSLASEGHVSRSLASRGQHRLPISGITNYAIDDMREIQIWDHYVL